ncbi:MAG: thymidine phosphorylase [Planctomycetota bacterium]
MNVAQIISAKRDGSELAESDIQQLVAGYATGDVPDYQMAAFAMAVFFQGMTIAETTVLTRAMLDSGEQLDWPTGNPVADKHSTGGIGDKVSIPLAPLLACCGVSVPMISGRGLGITGGTLDKLESIQGYRCDLSLDEFRSVVNFCGCSISGATGAIAPADKKLYALRDVTGTVPSIPMITASILSKKVAEGIDSLVLDVKWGSGAFMKTLERAQELARSLVTVGNQLGVSTTAVITDMNQPLGRMIGNAVEVDESVALLKGEAPTDLTQLTMELCIRILEATGVEPDHNNAAELLQRQIDTGAGLKKLTEMVANHGGNLDATREREKAVDIIADESGFVRRISSDRLGVAVIEMGGGRKQLGDQLNHATGIECLVKIGDEIEQGQPVARLFCDDENVAGYASYLVSAAIGISPIQPDRQPLIVETIK